VESASLLALSKSQNHPTSVPQLHTHPHLPPRTYTHTPPPTPTPQIWAPRPGHHMPGITKSLVLALAADEGLTVKECDFSLAQVYGADEAFVTGT